MNQSAADAATAATLLWLRMALAISFLEAPLTFRAPGRSAASPWPPDAITLPARPRDRSGGKRR